MEKRQKDVLKSLAMAGINVSEIETCVDFGSGHGGVMPNFRHKLENHVANHPVAWKEIC